MQAHYLTATALLAALCLTATPAAQARPSSAAAKSTIADATALLAAQARDSGRPAFTPATAVRFAAEDNVYLKSALAIDLTYGSATVTLPLFKGYAPDGSEVHYILTEASDFAFARRMGLNFAPKLAAARGSAGAQVATIRDGRLQFRGNVDFSPEYKVAPGSPSAFPPSVAVPGAVADADWSSIVSLPSGIVLNAQIVHNASGGHDRMKAIDLKRMTVTLSILDGFQNGRQYFYHLVTDASADVPSVIEKGVYAPRLAMLPTFGKSMAGDGSALLGFAPVANGITDVSTGQAQGFAASLANGGIDPINVFPIAPANDDPSLSNNYSPLWDAHVMVWTDAAIKAGKVRRIVSFDDIAALVKLGYVTSAAPDGPGNPYVAGLNPLKVIINCPVIAHPTRVKR